MERSPGGSETCPFLIAGTLREICKVCDPGMVATIKEDESVECVTHGQGRDILGARACTRCHGYIERNPVLVIGVLEPVVRCVNCGRLDRRVNSHLERYPSRKKEWDEIEGRNRNGHRR